ncbi:MAG: Gfo/Idh/MocA family oxidoreductase [Clostridia bacterium]|nr:Gfo/Idh/MocA family oxidoreductase [Clostridia bacterium]
MKNQKLCVALVGVSFGASFIPIYLQHPQVDRLILVDTDTELLKRKADKFLLSEEHCTTDYNEVLNDPTVDAIHLVVPPALHAPMSIQALNAGKHCACTIPMGMTMGELEDIIRARKASGKNYMFMETAVYTREYLYVKELYESGEMGRLQYMRCAHYQDMEGWPSYWDGYPPLMHPTHAIAPCFALSGQRPVSVFGKGSGRVRQELANQYGCPFAFESALVTLEDGETTVEMERFLYHVARGYSECFCAYGENKSFEWDQLNGESHVLFCRDLQNEDGKRGAKIDEERIEIPDYAHRLPAEIGRFTRKVVYDEKNPHLAFKQGGGHGGSHPHLVHEFVMSILENRTPFPSDIDAAYWTGVGLLAHESAMEGGKVKILPKFEMI